jgi:putative thioredoxin
MSNVPPPPTNLRGAVDLSSLVHRPAEGSPAGGTARPGGAELTLPSLYFEGTDANFNDFIDLSTRVPVVVDLGTARSEQWAQFSPLLERVVGGFGGRLVLVRIDVDANPQLTQAFQATAVPTVAALVAGRPLQLFSGAAQEDQLKDVLEQLLQLAAQNGVTDTVTVDGPAGEQTDQGEPAPEPPLPPLHAEAYEAIDRGDYEGAIRAYRTAIAQDPRDTMAVAGLAQVSLLSRLSGHSADELRTAAAEAPRDAAAQLGVADLDISGGHVEDAFDRLLSVFPVLDADGKEQVRTRLLDYFEIVGVDDPRVAKARARLASLLY